LKPSGTWNGRDKQGHKFKIHGYSDSDYAKDPETRIFGFGLREGPRDTWSVSGYATFLEDAHVTANGRMQDCVTLSVTEAELVAAIMCVQDMLYTKKVLESMELQVALPMTLYVDNKGAKDLVNNWSVGDRTWHMDVRYHFLPKLKEANIVRVQWVSTHDNCTDMFTKNLPAGPVFTKHASTFCGDDPKVLRISRGTVLESSRLLAMTIRFQKGPGLELAVRTSTRSTDVGLLVNRCCGKTQWSFARHRNGELLE
jgi:hypothetical protein